MRDGVTPGLRPELHVGRAFDWRSERRFRGRNQRGLLSVSENCLNWRVTGSTERILMPITLGFMRRSYLTSQHPRLHPAAATRLGFGQIRAAAHTERQFPDLNQRRLRSCRALLFSCCASANMPRRRKEHQSGDQSATSVRCGFPSPHDLAFHRTLRPVWNNQAGFIAGVEGVRRGG